jgi:hypothetical protein
METSHRRGKVQFVSGAKTWDSVKTSLRKTGMAGSFLNTRMYYDGYEAILHGESGISGSRGWGQWVVVVTPSDRVHTSDELLSLVPQLTRSDEDLQLPASATGGKRMRVTETTRTIKLIDDPEWARDNNVCLECLGPEILLTNFRAAVVVVDSRVQNDGPWTVAGNQPGSYIANFNFARDIQRRLDRTHQVVFAKLRD